MQYAVLLIPTALRWGGLSYRQDTMKLSPVATAVFRSRNQAVITFLK